MGMLGTLVGTRLKGRYRKLFDLPDCVPSSTLPPPTGVPLHRASRLYIGESTGVSAVYRLDQGLPALGVRLGLLREAKVSIDIRSYLIKDDVAGNLVVRELLAAAERGVRVRLLMDDALTEAIDHGLITLSRHPRVEVRVFNPFPRRRSRLISLIANFNILNRRMHNKSFSVDTLATIVGGRNIADEYYQAGGQSEFVDEDLLLMGPVVDDVGEDFDRYWNSREAIPIDVFDVPDATLDVAELAAEGQAFLDGAGDHQLLSCVDSDITPRLLAAELPMSLAKARLVSDRPDKVRRLVRSPDSETARFLQSMVLEARQELIIVSPYFVPLKAGVDFLGGLVDRGVRVTVITNSLASTNHASVHAVYARYRKPLLERGVHLHELTPGPLRNPGAPADATQLTLHSKIAVTDRTQCFVGSFNLDPRSLYLNTEMGVAVDSSNFASEMAVSLLELLPRFTYRLRLSDTGRLQWTFDNDGRHDIYGKEPDTRFRRRFLTHLTGYLPIEGQM